MATEIGVRELRNNVTKIVKQVREEHAEYIVTVHGKPAAVLRPITPEDEERELEVRADSYIAELRSLAQEIAEITSTKTLRQQLEEDRSEA